ncbi:transposase, partial [uncultured Microbacterium sp.]|uniref:transposase n=1 Tax=uncultured Microbacterium sp. TaxID=191216 RepID=UPI00338D5083
MHTTAEVGHRRRRRHSDEFKAKVVAACRQPGVSIASVALAHELNANLLRRWIHERLG